MANKKSLFLVGYFEIVFASLSVSWLASLGRNFDDYPGFQLFFTLGKHFAPECKYLHFSFSQLHQSPNQIWQKTRLTEFVKILYGSLVEVQYPIFSSNPAQYLLNTDTHQYTTPMEDSEAQPTEHRFFFCEIHLRNSYLEITFWKDQKLMFESNQKVRVVLKKILLSVYCASKNSTSVVMLKCTDCGHPERAFFQKLETFGLGLTNWAEII